MNAVASWWDGVELWIAGLPFVPQVAVVLAVVVPAAAVVAVVADVVLSALFDARRRVVGKDRPGRVVGKDHPGRVVGKDHPGRVIGEDRPTGAVPAATESRE
ncbi:hypothetical protein SAMN05444374_101282 [Rhodococcoides kroppenstedtii]|uniref:Uncharacterized protein n=1 Tax=Rhodococcoides kroppenstedtii TaxID=293050 RepID=A0A1I0SIF5_9NOCA|nr:hypothetical protein [Rhodococcus kroppenstedtii]SFA39298.1 hypothetical protein SAMN05444374_101282 [Rhodococcus kroppenstedtii]